MFHYLQNIYKSAVLSISIDEKKQFWPPVDIRHTSKLQMLIENVFSLQD